MSLYMKAISRAALIVLRYALGGAIGGWTTAIGAAIVIGDWQAKGFSVAATYVFYGVVIGSLFAAVVAIPVAAVFRLDRISLTTILFCFATSGVFGGLAWGLISRLSLPVDTFSVITITVSTLTLLQLLLWKHRGGVG